MTGLEWTYRSSDGLHFQSQGCAVWVVFETCGRKCGGDSNPSGLDRGLSRISLYFFTDTETFRFFSENVIYLKTAPPV